MATSLLVVLPQDLLLEVELAGDLVTLLGAVQLAQPGALGNILQERERNEIKYLSSAE